MSNSLDVDFACVGGGLAGLVAACRAADLGLRAVVLEQGDGARYPCNSRFAGGVFHVAYQDMKLAKEQLVEVVTQATDGEADPGQVDAVASDADRLIGWLREHGARFIRGAVSWHSCVLAPPRPPTTGMDWAGRGPDVLLRTLTQHLNARGGTVLLDTRAEALRMKGEKCVGVIATKAGQAWRCNAAAVLLADGGFQGDPDLFRRFIGPRPDLVLQRGAGTGRGDGLRMAQEAGGHLTRLDRFYGHLLSRDALKNDQVWPYPQIDAISTAALVVDRSGTRFANEGLGGIRMANTIATLQDPTSATVICDRAIWEGPGREGQIPPNPLLEKAGGTVYRADRIADLARIAYLPPDALVQTVHSYNAAIDAGTAANLEPVRSAKKGKPWPIRQPPFLAIPICAGITNTMGGIDIDGVGRVGRPDGTLIDGLYAAGATTGGLEGGSEAGYVGGLVKAGVFALRAAEHAAMQIRAHRS